MTTWTDHVRQFADKNNMSYGCAMTDDRCRKEYHKKKGTARIYPMEGWYVDDHPDNKGITYIFRNMKNFKKYPAFKDATKDDWKFRIKVKDWGRVDFFFETKEVPHHKEYFNKLKQGLWEYDTNMEKTEKQQEKKMKQYTDKLYKD